MKTASGSSNVGLLYKRKFVIICGSIYSGQREDLQVKNFNSCNPSSVDFWQMCFTSFALSREDARVSLNEIFLLTNLISFPIVH